MTREMFDQSLKSVQGKILALGSAVAEDLGKSAQVLLKKDRQMAQQLIDFDNWVNNQRIEIMMECLALIATQQPTGPDMRSLAANIEIAGELERIHDYVKGIGKITLSLGMQQIPQPVKEILPVMAAATQNMMEDAMSAFAAVDAAAAQEIPPRDSEIDELYKLASHALAVSVTEELATYEHSNVLQWVVHNLERSADRVINICEWVVYLGTGRYVELDGVYKAQNIMGD